MPLTRRRAKRRRWLARSAVIVLSVSSIVVFVLIGIGSGSPRPPGGDRSTAPAGVRRPSHGGSGLGDHRSPSARAKANAPPEGHSVGQGGEAAGTGPLRGLPVTMGVYSFVDSTRPVVSNGVVLAPVRSLPTYVWAPTTPGRFPLVIFAQGYDVTPLTYQRFCSQLASSGYLVAAPSFPLEDPTRGFGLDRSDLPHEATDVSFLISALETSALRTRFNPAQVAVVGHSDGADVALMLGYQKGAVDARVRAIVSDAPDPMSGPVAASSVPLLLVQGNADSVVPYSSSQTVFAQVEAPRFYLTLLGADHLPPIQGGTPWTPVLDTAVADFLDAEVAGRAPGGAALAQKLSQLPLSHLQVAP